MGRLFEFGNACFAATNSLRATTGVAEKGTQNTPWLLTPTDYIPRESKYLAAKAYSDRLYYLASEGWMIGVRYYRGDVLVI
jgi:hypothetical protein